MTYRLGIDIGGTFTDFVLIGTATGEVHRGKCLTTPDDPVRGILTGLERMKQDFSLRDGDIVGAAHATTLVANTIIERKGTAAGFIATKGFRDVLEIGVDTRYDIYDLDISFPAPLVPRQHRLEIDERTGANGEPLKAPVESDVVARAQELIDAGVRSVAVCLLHAYRNPVHERAVRDVLRREFPDLDVSISSDVAPEIREYERASTTAANAYVRPVMESYLHRLSEALEKAGVAGVLFVMLSNGGVTHADTAAAVPIRLIESGPAAGVLGAIRVCGDDGGDLLAFDMGGTTAKVCLVTGGAPAHTSSIEVARVQRQFRGSGLPLMVSSIDMIEIGAGGGSIAHVDAAGLLKVGPRSAGANPGPACYGLGGELPTVTDANLILGYLSPDFFLGGDMALVEAKAEAAVGRIAQKIEGTLHDAAAGIVSVANNNMATAIRIHAAERGQDYRRYALCAFGGAGPVHAYELARLLKLPRIVCPLGAGTNSALGLLAAPVAVDLARSYVAPLEDVDWRFLSDLYSEMEEEATAILAEAGIEKPLFTRTAELRFQGQGFEVPATVPGGNLSGGTVAEVKANFAASYERLYRSLPGDLPLEALTWRLRASGPMPELKLGTHETDGETAARKATRNVYFPEAGDYLQTTVFDRYGFRPGAAFSGPAIVEERESTVVIGPGGQATIDDRLNLIVTLEPS
jgi:N-methylhydantoinase A